MADSQTDRQTPHHEKYRDGEHNVLNVMKNHTLENRKKELKKAKQAIKSSITTV